MNNIKRLQKELKSIMEDSPQGCKAAPVEGDLYHWTAAIDGPKGTLYEGGVFALDIVFPPDYPFKAPQCRFTTKIFHPNISHKGEICLDTLKQNWSPILTISKVLLSICSLLDDPNPSDPLNGDAAQLMHESKQAYEEKVRYWVYQYAGGGTE